MFVTGGAGYVGAHCCKVFANARWNVVVYDNLCRGWQEFVKWGPLIKGDILDYERLKDAMAEVNPDAVVHFAALAYVGESVSQPSSYYQANAVGTLNVLRAMQELAIESVVFSSSCATYGIPESSPIAESMRQSPINPYGWSKLFGEQLLRDFSAAYDIRYIALRYFNAAGADPDCEIGERHSPETHLIPLAIRAAMMDDYQLTIHGNDFNTRDGTCVRDYVHVVDLADAHLKALNHLRDRKASAMINLGTGAGTSVLEVTKAVERVSGSIVRRIVGPRRAGDPASLVALALKAKEMLGWAPTHSDVETIVADAWQWHKREASSGGS